MSEIVQRWLGLDPYILIEFVVENGDIKINLSSSLIPAEDIAKTLEDVAAAFREQNEA